LEQKYWEDLVFAAVNRIYESEANDIIEKEQNNVFTEEDFEYIEMKVQEKYDELADKYLINTDLKPTIDPFKEIDIESIISENKRADAEADAHDDWRDYNYQRDNNDSLIDDLFSSFDK